MRHPGTYRRAIDEKHGGNRHACALGPLLLLASHSPFSAFPYTQTYMKQVPRIFTTRLRVRYSETDQMSVVYHANYFAWFEVGRVEMMRELGFAYREMEAHDGCVLPVVEVSCRYRQPARYDDELELSTSLVALRGPVLKFAYQLRRAGAAMPGQPGPLLADAVTTHVVVDRELNTTTLPEKYLSVLLPVVSQLPQDSA